jgi:hypothetical protein
VFGFDYAIVGVKRSSNGLRLFYAVNKAANKPGAPESLLADLDVKDSTVYLRVTVLRGALCHFSYSLDGHAFAQIGGPFQASGDRWIGAKVGVIASAPANAEDSGHADFKWFHVGPAIP